MKPLPAPGKAATTLVSDVLKTPVLRKLFLERNRDSQISFLLHHLIGPETERFAAEPVYAVTGIGSLKSKGVDGLREEQELEDFLRGEEGRDYVEQTLQLVREELERKAALENTTSPQ